MRKLTAAAILLAAITIIPAYCQEAVAVDPAAAVPGMPVIATPAPDSPQAGWVEAVSAEVGPVVGPVAEAPAAEVVVPTEPPVNNPQPVQNWTQTQADNTPQIKYVNTERNELLNRMVEQQIYVQRDVNGNAVVPEPSSFIAMAVGLTGIAATVSRRRKK